MTARPLWRILADQAAILAVLAGLSSSLIGLPRRQPAPPPRSFPTVPTPNPTPEPEPEPAPPPAPVLDRAAVARAQGALDAARREREDTEHARTEAESRLADLLREVEKQEQAARELAALVNEPGTRLAAVRQRGVTLQAERDRLRTELVSLADNPRPRRKPFIDKTPVARPIDGEEFHFEVRRDRIAYIDLERLIDKVKADAVLQMRLGASGTRPITSTVGPIGDFALRYELGRDLPSSLDEAMRARGVSYSLRGWEVVPVRELRGEPLAALPQPASRVGRVLNSLQPDHATITLWIYPDGFGSYRQLRDLLHARGFTVAARPLPAGLTIRGSPAGSLSAGQ